MRRPGAAAFARRAGGARGPRLVLPVRLAAAAIVVLGAASARAARVEPLEWTARLEAIGDLKPTTPDEMRNRVTAELATWIKVVDEAKIPKQ